MSEATIIEAAKRWFLYLTRRRRLAIFALDWKNEGVSPSWLAENGYGPRDALLVERIRDGALQCYRDCLDGSASTPNYKPPPGILDAVTCLAGPWMLWSRVFRYGPYSLEPRRRIKESAEWACRQIEQSTAPDDTVVATLESYGVAPRVARQIANLDRSAFEFELHQAVASTDSHRRHLRLLTYNDKLRSHED